MKMLEKIKYFRLILLEKILGNAIKYRLVSKEDILHTYLEVTRKRFNDSDKEKIIQENQERYFKIRFVENKFFGKKTDILEEEAKKYNMTF